MATRIEIPGARQKSYSFTYITFTFTRKNHQYALTLESAKSCAA